MYIVICITIHNSDVNNVVYHLCSSFLLYINQVSPGMPYAQTVMWQLNSPTTNRIFLLLKFCVCETDNVSRGGLYTDVSVLLAFSKEYYKLFCLCNVVVFFYELVMIKEYCFKVVPIFYVLFVILEFKEKKSQKINENSYRYSLYCSYFFPSFYVKNYFFFLILLRDSVCVWFSHNCAHFIYSDFRTF